MVPPLITLEEHYVSDHIRAAQIGGDRYSSFPKRLVDKLVNLGDDLRIKDMDEGKVTLQIVSHGPLDADPSAVRRANNELATACQAHPKRLAGFAMLSMQEPSAAAEELERCVKEHGFKGALINNHYQGTFYDDEKFWPVFKQAVKLNVPIYIHPTFATEEMGEHYKGNFSDHVATWMSMAGWGWHTETGLHVLRLWASGLFDKHPKLKIIIGHMGEMLPFQLDRIIGMSHMWSPDRQRDLRTVWRENIWVTTSGMFSLAPLACLLRMSPIDKIMYSVDYPFSENTKGIPFVEAMETSGLLKEGELDLICYGNAEKLLGVSVAS